MFVFPTPWDTISMLNCFACKYHLSLEFSYCYKCFLSLWLLSFLPRCKENTPEKNHLKVAVIFNDICLSWTKINENGFQSFFSISGNAEIVWNTYTLKNVNFIRKSFQINWASRGMPQRPRLDHEWRYILSLSFAHTHKQKVRYEGSSHRYDGISFVSTRWGPTTCKHTYVYTHCLGPVCLPRVSVHLKGLNINGINSVSLPSAIIKHSV